MMRRRYLIIGSDRTALFVLRWVAQPATTRTCSLRVLVSPPHPAAMLPKFLSHDIIMVEYICI